MTSFTRFSFRLLALASVAALGACSNATNDPVPGTTGTTTGTTTPTTTPTTYGSSWTADGTSYTATNSTTNITNGILQVALIQGAGGDSYFTSLTVPAATGTYTLDGTNTYLAGYNTSVGGTTTSYAAGSGFGGSGTITVTTFSSTEVIGTFSFTGANASNPGGASVVVTNGKFSIKR